MSQETKTKIEKLQKAIDSPATPENVKKALRTALEKLQKEIIADDMEKFKEGDLKTSAGKTVTDVKQAKAIAMSEAGKSKKKSAKKVAKSTKKAAKKATKPKKSKVEPADMGKLKALINSLKNKKGYEFLKKLDLDSVKRDAERKAKKAGKRISADGNVYYEYRRNRTDVNQKIKLADGGEITGENVNITDKNSLFKGKSGVVTGNQGKMLMVKILVDGGERTVMVSKKGVKVIKNIKAEGGNVYPIDNEREKKTSGFVLLTKDTEKEAKDYVSDKPSLFYEKFEDKWAIKRK